MSRLAVVLFNLGGPDRLDAVAPFLTNLFSDPAIIRLPNPWRVLLARFIARRRHRTAEAIYARIGGGSPLLANTRAQADALQSLLDQAGGEARVFIAMRHWHPLSEATAADVAAYRPERVLCLPLYPQFSTTTTASSFAAWQKAASKAGIAAPSRLLCCYPTEPGFIAALADLTRKGLDEAAVRQAGRPLVIFTAHGLPQRIAKEGDPYAEQVDATCRAVATALGLRDEDWQLGFQSRVGPLAWLGPYTDELIVAASEARRAIVLVSVSFVSEHSETLVELDMDYARLADDHGAPAYIRVPTVGTHPAFIEGLARTVAQAQNTDAAVVAQGRRCSAGATSCPLRTVAARS